AGGRRRRRVRGRDRAARRGSRDARGDERALPRADRNGVRHPHACGRVSGALREVPRVVSSAVDRSKAAVRQPARSTVAAQLAGPAGPLGSEGGAMSAPTVSVLMTAYNRERYIAASIESVLAQTFDDLELVVVDDGSGDGTVEIARRFARRDP